VCGCYANMDGMWLESTTTCGVGSLARLAAPRPLQKRFRKTFLTTGTPRLTSVTVNRYATYLRLNGRISSSTQRCSLRTTRLHPFHPKTCGHRESARGRAGFLPCQSNWRPYLLFFRSDQNSRSFSELAPRVPDQKGRGRDRSALCGAREHRRQAGHSIESASAKHHSTPSELRRFWVYFLVLFS
jgi:hypothetical protein